MIRNELTVEATVSLLFYGTSAGFLGLILEFISLPHYDGHKYNTDDLILLVVGICFFLGGATAGLALTLKKRQLIFLAQIIYLLGFLVTAGMLVEALIELLDEPFVLLALLFLFIGLATLILLVLGNRRIFPWLAKTTLEE